MVLGTGLPSLPTKALADPSGLLTGSRRTPFITYVLSLSPVSSTTPLNLTSRMFLEITSPPFLKSNKKERAAPLYLKVLVIPAVQSGFGLPRTCTTEALEVTCPAPLPADVIKRLPLASRLNGFPTITPYGFPACN